MKTWTKEEILALRKSLDITQEEMGHRLQVSSAAITRWERGVSKPSRMARRLLDSFEVENSSPDNDVNRLTPA